MKKMYTQPARSLRLLLPAAVCFCYALSPHASYGQTYYSTFGNPTGKFSVTEPSGNTCNAPAVQDAAAFADGNINNFTSIKGSISSPLTCTNGGYTFTTFLNLPPDSPYVSAGLQAGFRIKVPSGINIARLTQNISIQTFLGTTMQESYNGDSIHPIDLATDSSRFIVYVNTRKNFNRLQLTVNSNIIPLNTIFEFDVIYAIASNAQLLPVTISSYNATAAGNNVTVSWQSLNEVNLSGYRIEKSSNNGTSYTAVAMLPAKGGSGAISYSYTDKAVANGNYLYRIVAIDKDGFAKTTNAVLVTIAGKAFLKLMPSIVKGGQAVIVNSGIAGNYQLAVFDLQGRMVKQQQVNSNDKVMINTSGLSAGTYVVKIMTPSGGIMQAKFIVD
ncbi:T9SS type A sorting domain-containing protein [Ilyomonas limi]|uniref:T9SS type A sorting domain-containing protein n=1 Tax=Ilyomonas limi TaxID=2575867 RepID=A0A4V5UUC8_9BACT|nr:T9SS type A sorting domain-containing protein [Ilyomonas limi]TKK68573.1 T9SS type A sorting domain-containing protein [Ilyomonas limi]